jgi:hypothetical protein
VDDVSGNSVSTAGDVNGDGLNDLIVGARGKLKAGKFYVIFGKKDNTTIDLSASIGVGFAKDDIGFSCFHCALPGSMSTNNQII